MKQEKWFRQRESFTRKSKPELFWDEQVTNSGQWQNPRQTAARAKDHVWRKQINAEHTHSALGVGIRTENHQRRQPENGDFTRAFKQGAQISRYEKGKQNSTHKKTDFSIETSTRVLQS
jgi:hypothetical protein